MLCLKKNWLGTWTEFDNDGAGDESTLVKRRPNDSEFLDLDAKFDKSGI